MKVIIRIFIIILSANILYSQGGSNYSIIGIGDINYDGNAAYSALSGTSAAFPSITAINFKNPALWSLVTTTRLQAGYKFSQHLNDKDNLSNFQNSGSINGFSAIFAIDTSYGIAASIGVLPYSSINYLTATKIQSEIDGSMINGSNTYQGKGGISMAYFGLSTKIIDNLSFGASAFASFGKVSTSRLTEYSDDPYLFKYTSSKDDFFSGLGFKGGLYYQPFKNFSLGYFLESNDNLEIESKLIYSSPLIGDTTLISNSSYRIPLSQGFGISYLSGVFIIGADFSFQDYKDFNYNPGANSEFTNSWQFNIGVNRFGNESINASTLDKISYKFGFGTKKLYYTINGNDIMEYSFSMGASVPWSESFNSDISLNFGSRGSSGIGLIREYFAKLTIDLSIGEVWFIPFKREY